jgi:predicted nucleic acid-binding protein
VILVDTNLLVRRASPADADRPHAIAAIEALEDAGESLCIVPQNIYEFWAAATRPRANNGLGLTAAECQLEVGKLRRSFVFLPDHSDLFGQWELLVVSAACHGRISFDARLVAAMRNHGIAQILSFNRADFSRFPGIAVIDPRSFSSPSPPAAGP